MEYVSTRDSAVSVSAAQAITRGISADGGLFMPKVIPALSTARLEEMVQQDYAQRACSILSDYLTDFSAEELKTSVESAYAAEKFGGYPAPLKELGGGTYMLELWHGPTCAFKDMALQLLPHLLTRSAAKATGGGEIVILVATSGDTGKAALEGFRDVPGTRILVFYPKDGVSRIQQLQMQTQEGENVGVCGVYGNFDDTQTAVKQIFTDPAIAKKLEAEGRFFSSANSINWGRLVPQIVYYVSAYCDLVRDGRISLGALVNIAVPTGNFGNILAAWYAREMGLPVNKLLCASNINNVLTDFISTGVYDRRRQFHMTSSPSMDILISSNLERLLYALHGGDDQAVKTLMAQLTDQGFYAVPDPVRETMQRLFYGGCCDESTTFATIRDTFERSGYLCDTHTAVGLAVHSAYRRSTGDETPTIVASTANPYKFAGSILTALGVDAGDADGFRQVELLRQRTGIEPPPQILALREKPLRFGAACKREEMAHWVLDSLR